MIHAGLLDSHCKGGWPPATAPGLRLSHWLSRRTEGSVASSRCLHTPCCHLWGRETVQTPETARPPATKRRTQQPWPSECLLPAPLLPPFKRGSQSVGLGLEEVLVLKSTDCSDRTQVQFLHPRGIPQQPVTPPHPASTLDTGASEQGGPHLDQAV